MRSCAVKPAKAIKTRGRAQVPLWWRRKESIEFDRVIGLPFFGLALMLDNERWDITVEGYFISKLDPSERVLLVSKALPKPRLTEFTSLEIVKPAYEKVQEVLSSLKEGYELVLKQLRELREKRVQSKGSGFGLGYLTSETRRLFLGGLAGKPPEIDLSDYSKLSFLKSLYEMAVFRKGRTPIVMGGEKFTVPFHYSTDKKILREVDERYSSFSKILNSLARNKRVDLSIA
uniref:Uncharacterized protein n=1 Tax=Fervidicoccus fontis TaxID=683846 RepID=A0A7J3ZIX7_9CREN